MPESNRRILLSCLVIAVAILVCGGILLAAAGVFALLPKTAISQSGQPTAVIQETLAVPSPGVATPEPFFTPTSVFPAVTEQVTATVEVTSTMQSPTVAASATGSLPPDVVAQMDAIQQQDVQLRGLQPKQPVARALISQQQLKDYISSEFLKSYTQQDAQDDVIVNSAFGLINPDFDLYHFTQSLLDEEIAGFYDDKTKKMFVIQGEGFQGPERFTYSHEYEHALQDQNFDIEHGLNYRDDTCKTQIEYCAAVQALLEGDATLTQMAWLQSYGTQQDYAQIQQFAQNLKTPVLDSAPPYLRDDFVFPYQQGRDFVQALYNNGGWQAVDQAFKNPPVSTEQILHPDRYPSVKPVVVNLPDLSSIVGQGWRLVRKNNLGEWYTYLVLADGIKPEYRLDSTKAQNASNGWGGDTYEVFYNEQSKATIMVIKYVWDDNSSASQFASAFREYAINRFGSPSGGEGSNLTWDSQGLHTEFHLSGKETTWILTPDAATAQKIWSAVQNP